jgi:hypothetical protein
MVCYDMVWLVMLTVYGIHTNLYFDKAEGERKTQEKSLGGSFKVDVLRLWSYKRYASYLPNASYCGFC